MNLPVDVLEHIVTGVGGAFISLVGAYFVVGRDLAFVKGQLSQLMTAVRKVDLVEKAVALLEKAHVSQQKDLNHAFRKIRDLGDEPDEDEGNGTGHDEAI